MYRIIDGRSSGKTSRLMLLAKETGAKIACNNPSAMRQKAYAYGITGIDFISYSDLFTNKYDHDKILIDEIKIISGKQQSLEFTQNMAGRQLLCFCRLSLTGTRQRLHISGAFLCNQWSRMQYQH